MDDTARRLLGELLDGDQSGTDVVAQTALAVDVEPDALWDDIAAGFDQVSELGFHPDYLAQQLLHGPVPPRVLRAIADHLDRQIEAESPTAPTVLLTKLAEHPDASPELLWELVMNRSRGGWAVRLWIAVAARPDLGCDLADEMARRTGSESVLATLAARDVVADAVVDAAADPSPLLSDASRRSVAERILVNPSTTTDMIDRLVDLGGDCALLACRHPNTSDDVLVRLAGWEANEVAGQAWLALARRGRATIIDEVDEHHRG